MDRRRKRGFAASTADKLKARQRTLLRWQKLLAITLEYVYSLRWTQKAMMKVLETARAEMRRWPASPKLQAGFDAVMLKMHSYLVEHIPQEDRRPSWSTAREACRHRDAEGKAATKEYKAAGSTWRRCNQCGSRWKRVHDAHGASAWEEVEPIPYPGGSAPTCLNSKANNSTSRSAGLLASPASSGAYPTRRPSATRSRTSPSLVRTAVMEVDQEDLPPLLTGPEHHSMSTDQEGSSREVTQPTAAELLTPALSEDEAAAARPDSWEQLEDPVLSDVR